MVVVVETENDNYRSRQTDREMLTRDSESKEKHRERVCGRCHVLQLKRFIQCLLLQRCPKLSPRDLHKGSNTDMVIATEEHQPGRAQALTVQLERRASLQMVRQFSLEMWSARKSSQYCLRQATCSMEATRHTSITFFSSRMSWPL